jgi:D-alanine-D-alanine ligase
MNSDDKPGGNGHNSGNGNGSLMPKKLTIVYSEVKREYFPTEVQYITEKDAETNAEAVAGYVEKLGIKAHLIPANADLAQHLRTEKPEMVMNLVDSVRGNEYLSSTIPAILEFLQIPYTGTSVFGMSLCFNKFLTKKVLEQNGIPVPRYQLFNTSHDFLDPTLRFPLISKLNEIHGSVEITQDSVSENERHLRDRLKYLIKTYDQEVLVEEFVVGREISAFILEGVNKKVYLIENIFTETDRKYKFADFNLQWIDQDSKIINQKYNDPLLKEYVKKAFDITRMSDYSKFDIRLDNSGRYYFIDSNANPLFGPKEIECPLANALELYSVGFMEILKRLINNTMREAYVI